jgi:hypothetical protein
VRGVAEVCNFMDVFSYLQASKQTLLALFQPYVGVTRVLVIGKCFKVAGLMSPNSTYNLLESGTSCVPRRDVSIRLYSGQGSWVLAGIPSES